MESKKINQLATNVAPVSSDLTIIGDPITGVSKKITLSQIASLFAGSVDFYANYASFPATGLVNTIYCAKDTQKLYLWSGSAYVETFPSQAVLNTYQLLSAKGVANGYASLDAAGKVPIAQLPSSIMEYKGLWSAATNTPTLANGTGDTGDVYIASAAGTVNFGAGGITFAIGDYVIYSGTIWQRSSGAVGTVTSVGLSSATSGVTIGSSPITTSGTITLAIATATTSQNGLLSSTDWATFNGKESVLTFTSPLSRSTNTISIPAATTSVNGYLDSADFTTFNNKQNAITLTTTGTSGASTFVGATLNIPNYGSALTGYVPYTGATQDVDLGAFKLNAQSLHIKGTGGLGHLGLKHQSASATSSANESVIFADSLGDLGWQNANLYLSKFITSANTANRSYTFPNATCNIPDDSLIVHLAGTETITGAKTFSGGVTFTSSLTTTSNVTFSNSGFTLVLQPPTLSVNRTVTFADITGTIAMLEGTQTFTGTKTFNANPSINTGGQSSLSILSSTGNSALIFGYVNNILKGTIDISATEFKFASAINSTFKFQASGLGIASLIFDNTTNYSYTFPAASGTIALVGGSGVGTVTSVAALTIGTSGTDLSSSVANSTTTPVITLNVPTASATNRGALSSADWTTFNNKQGTITLTTTGTSGAATFTSNTLNIPNYGSALSGYLPLTGGTLTGALNINLASGTALNVAGNAIFRGDTGVGTPRQLIITSGGSTPVYLEAKGYGANYQTDFGIKTFNNVGTAFEVFYADSSGRVGINQTSPSYQLDVNGTGRYNGVLTVTDGTQGLNIRAYTGGSGFGAIYSTGVTAGAGNFALAASATQTILSGVDSVSLAINSAIKLSISSTGAATFTGNVGITLADTPQLLLTHSNTSKTFLMAVDGSNAFFRANSTNNLLFQVAGGTTALTIASTGAATFSSSVTANTFVELIGDLRFNSTSADRSIYFRGSAGSPDTNWKMGNYLTPTGATVVTSAATVIDVYGGGGSAYGFMIRNTLNAPLLQIAGNTGAATFSSSVTQSASDSRLLGGDTAGRYIISNSDTSAYMAIYGSASATANQIGLITNSLITFNTGSGYSERMRITSGGNVLITDSSGNLPTGYGTNRLVVNGGIYATSSVAAVVAADLDMMVFQNTGATYTKSCLVASMTATGGTGSYFFYGQQSTSTAAIKIFSNGNIQNTNNSYGAISDARLKENIKDATPKLDDLMKVKVRNYNLKGESNKQLGVISQELEAIFPNMIEESTNMGENMKIKGVKYSVFVPMLIKAVQELKAEIEILKNK